METTTLQIQKNTAVKPRKGKSQKPEAKKKAYRVASLFSGSGGMDLGFKDAGFDIIWANDVNHWACETFRKNFGDHVAEGSITAVKDEDIQIYCLLKEDIKREFPNEIVVKKASPILYNLVLPK